MAFSLNKIQLIGNLGKDAETRFTQNNVGITNFSVATTSGYKDKEGNWKNETTWHNCTLFNASDFIKDSLKKGAKVYIEGRISKKEYTDKEGIKRYSADVITEKILPLSEHHEPVETSTPEIPDNSNSQTGTMPDDDLPF